MSHHIVSQIRLNAPQSFPNVFRSEHSSHRNLFEWHLRLMSSCVKSVVIDSRLWRLGSHQATHGHVDQSLGPSVAHLLCTGLGDPLSVLLYCLLCLPISEKPGIGTFSFNVDLCVSHRMGQFSLHFLKQGC